MPDQQHILLALCGTSPAILTETIWALAMEHATQPELVDLPDRVIVLTTKQGADAIRSQLLSNTAKNEKSIWQQLRQSLAELGFNTRGKLTFGDTSEHLRVFSRPCELTGLASPLDDIRNAEDQTATADFLLETLRSFTEHPGVHITASLAGGRKTMSSLLYGCMTLVGRHDDRLTHVLVSEPYENPRLQPRFYFPAQEAQQLHAEGNAVIQANDATVTLMDVPFIPIRYTFEKHLGNTPAGFRQLVATYTGKALAASSQLPLRLRHSDTSLQIGSESIHLSTKEFLIIHFLAQRAQNSKPAYPDYKSGLEDLDTHCQKLKNMAPAGNLAHPFHTLPASIDAEDMRKLISSLRKKIKDHTPGCADLLNALPEKGRLSLEYPSELITIISS